MSNLFRHSSAPVSPTRGGSAATTIGSQRRIVGMGCPPDQATVQARLATLGLTRIRCSLYWLNWIQDPGRYPAAFDSQVIQPCVAHGYEPIIVVLNPPDAYVNDRANGQVALASFMAARATQYPGRIWQILNEMDGDDGFNGGWYKASDGSVTQLQRGQWYGATLELVGAAIRGADSTAKVIAGGASRGDGSVPATISDFFKGLQQTCSRAHYDAWDVHCYGSPLTFQFSKRAPIVRGVDPGVPLYCTEFGFDSSDDITQATQIAACLDLNDQHILYDRAYLYKLIGDDEPAAYYGVCHADGTPRAAFNLFANRTAN